jgi:hypothetical protein
MAKNLILSNVLALTKTATNDLKFQMTTSDIWIREGNFIITGNSVNTGDSNVQPLTLGVSSAFSFQDFNLKDIFFINTNAGSNATVNFQGILMTPAKMRELGAV